MYYYLSEFAKKKHASHTVKSKSRGLESALENNGS